MSVNAVVWTPPSREIRSLSLLWFLASASALLLKPVWTGLAAFSPVCPFREWTGMACLSCGTTRAGLAFLEGNVLGALAWNPLAAVAGLVFVAGGILLPLWIAAGGRVVEVPSPLPAAWRWGVVAVLAANWAYLIWRGV